MYHCEPRQKKLGLLKLEDLYKLQVNCLTYDCLQGDAPEQYNTLFMRKKGCGSSLTRSQRNNPYDIKLQKPESNPGPVTKSSFSHVAPTFWNSLPNSLKSCSTKAEFCRKVKQHLLEPYIALIIALSSNVLIDFAQILNTVSFLVICKIPDQLFIPHTDLNDQYFFYFF